MTGASDTAQPTQISDDALNQLFRQARTHNAWLPKLVPLEALREAYELARWGPTNANSPPARFIFLESAAGQGGSFARFFSRERRKNEGSAGDRNCCLGHRVLREASQVVSPSRHAFRFRREPVAGRGDGVSQQFAAGRLLHSRRPGGGA